MAWRGAAARSRHLRVPGRGTDRPGHINPDADDQLRLTGAIPAVEMHVEFIVCSLLGEARLPASSRQHAVQRYRLEALDVLEALGRGYLLGASLTSTVSKTDLTPNPGLSRHGSDTALVPGRDQRHPRSPVSPRGLGAACACWDLPSLSR